MFWDEVRDIGCLDEDELTLSAVLSFVTEHYGRNIKLEDVCNVRSDFRYF